MYEVGYGANPAVGKYLFTYWRKDVQLFDIILIYITFFHLLILTCRSNII